MAQVVGSQITVKDLQEVVARKTGGAVTPTYTRVHRAIRAGWIPAIHFDGVNRIRFRQEMLPQISDTLIALATGGAA